MKYAWHQAEELARLGNKVLVLCDKGAGEQAPRSVILRDELVPEPSNADGRGKIRRMLSLVKQLVWNQFILFRSVLRCRPNVVLLASYCEYLSPIWVWLQLFAAKVCGVTFVAVLHDPVRNFVVGPSLWHTMSVQMAYWPLAAVFVHQKAPPEAGIPSEVRVYEVPHGLFPVGKSMESREALRSRWGIPEEAVVFLSFGFIRDSKNLDLLIRALPDSPNAYLVVAGRVQSQSANRPVEFYETLASQLGVARKVKLIVEFIPDEDVVGYLQAADVLALTYSASFRSQSGVLNTAAHVNKPLLASSGPGPLKDCVEKFSLGEFVAPDDAQALSDGMAKLTAFVEAQRQGRELPHESQRLDWQGYRDYASWRNNARIVIEAVAAVRNGKLAL